MVDFITVVDNPAAPLSLTFMVIPKHLCDHERFPGKKEGISSIMLKDNRWQNTVKPDALPPAPMDLTDSLTGSHTAWSTLTKP